MKQKCLFLTHINNNYNFYSYCKRSSGLYNSTRFIVEGLQDRGVRAKIEEIVDMNSIDREVTKYRPDIVIIEALFVVPEKFKVLKKLHPRVKWFVHMHSGVPFLAQEGIAMDWLNRYSYQEQIGIIANSPDTFDAFKEIVLVDHLFHLPNVYIEEMRLPNIKPLIDQTINIACFGAIRPMKDQLSQAFAAIKFANKKDLFLRFHINSSRVEVGGEPVLKNLRALFKTQRNAQLVEHGWVEHIEFIEMLRATIDIGSQISMSETFNVVSANYVTAGIPTVGSHEISWLSEDTKAKIDSIESAVAKYDLVWKNLHLIAHNQRRLQDHTEKAQDLWFKFVNQDHTWI